MKPETHASSHNVAFGNFAVNNYSRLNSRVSIKDLHGYAKTFDSRVRDRFRTFLDQRKRQIDARLGKNIESAYGQILSWRHDFAHAGIRNTTIEEALATHRFAKRVLYVFDRAFNGP
jgi:hypothetical protein